MTESTLIAPFVTIILAATPLSLIIIKYFKKTFSSHDSNLANTTVICTDLTGTLTKDELKVKSVDLINKYVTTDNKKNDLEIEDRNNKEIFKTEKITLKQEKNAEFMAIIANLCEYSRVVEIEKIIAKFFLECGFGKHKIENDYAVIQKIPSNEDKKISTIVAIKNESREIFAFSKGHPSQLLGKCSRISLNGKKIEMTGTEKAKMKKLIKNMIRDGQKLIGFAYKGLPLKRLDHYSENFTENDLIFLGIVGMSQPVNTDLKPSIELAKEIGIKTYITTSAKEKQAVSAGIELGIINSNYFEALTGADIEEKKLHKVTENREKDFVFAELSEEDKLRIMEHFRKNGETVAVANSQLGNDYKRVITGVIKERAAKLNAKKVISHSIISKSTEIAAIIICLMFNVPIPLTIISILILELAINLPLEFALKLEKVGQKVVRRIYEKIDLKIDRKMIIKNTILFTSAFILMHIFNLYRFGWTFGNETPLSPEIKAKIVTNNLVFLGLLQILNAFARRSHLKSLLGKKITKNSYLLPLSVIALLSMFLLENYEIIGNNLNLKPLSSIDWQINLFAVLVIFIAIEAFRFYKRKHANTNTSK